MGKKVPIYYDTETTGMKFEEDHIIELAAFNPVTNATFSSLINPGRPIPKEATAIHNITDEMVQEAKSFAFVGQEFIDFCGEDAVLIAHNNDAFDKKFLEVEFRRVNIEMPNWAYIDTLKWARKFRPDLPRHALQVLREVYNVPANNAHRALDDVVVLHSVFSQMIDDLEIETVLDLLATANTKELSRMPFGKYQGKLLKDIPKHYLKWLNENGALDKEQNKELKTALEKIGAFA